MFVIRWANQLDTDDLGAIHAASFVEAYKDVMPEEILKGFTAENRTRFFVHEIKNKTSETAIMLVDGAAMGFMTLGSNRDDDLDNTVGEIWGVYLLPSYWGKGYGKKLMAWGETLLKQRGHPSITLWVLESNVRARTFYESIGYRRDGAKKALPFDKALTKIRYHKGV